MLLDNPDVVTVNGSALKRRILSYVTDMQAHTVAARRPDRYSVPNSDGRVNLFKARDAAAHERMRACSGSDPWVRELIGQWVAMSGLPTSEADFWRSPGFMEAIREGRDIQMRRYLDDDEWAWILIRDIPTLWTVRKRLPETARLTLVARKRRQQKASRW